MSENGTHAVFGIVKGAMQIVFTIIELILLFRFMLKLFGANPGAGFVQWVYSISAPLFAWFAGIFPSIEIQDGFILELSTLFAMIIYLVIYLAIIALINALERAAIR